MPQDAKGQPDQQDCKCAACLHVAVLVDIFDSLTAIVTSMSPAQVVMLVNTWEMGWHEAGADLWVWGLASLLARSISLAMMTNKRVGSLLGPFTSCFVCVER